MGSNQNRKELIREYKEQKIPRGIFVVRCSVTGQAWVDSSLDLRAARNGLFFGLRSNSFRNLNLLAAWNTHGEQAFEFDILESLDDDVAPMSLRDVLKAKKLYWMAQLSAQSVAP